MVDIYRDVNQLLQDSRSAPDRNGDELDAALATAAGFARVAWHLARAGTEDEAFGLTAEDPRDTLALLALTDALAIATSRALVIHTVLQQAARASTRVPAAPTGAAGSVAHARHQPPRQAPRPVDR